MPAVQAGTPLEFEISAELLLLAREDHTLVAEAYSKSLVTAVSGIVNVE